MKRIPSLHLGDGGNCLTSPLRGVAQCSQQHGRIKFNKEVDLSRGSSEMLTEDILPGTKAADEVVTHRNRKIPWSLPSQGITGDLDLSPTG